MYEKCSHRVLNFRSDNLKSKIQNLRWLGLSVIAFVLVMSVVVAQAQQAKKVVRIGYLITGTPSAQKPYTEAFLEGLRDLGYIEDQNILIEYRYAQEKLERYPAIAAELVSLKVDVMVTGGSTATRSAKRATNTIPIVMAQDPDPVGNGFVTSLARPGGNITGLSSLVAELVGKRLELLREVVSQALSIGRVWDVN